MRNLFLALICVGSPLLASEYKPVHIAQIIKRCKEGSSYQPCNFLRVYIDKFYPVMCAHQGYFRQRDYSIRPSHISEAQEETCRYISDALSDMQFASQMLNVKYTENYFNDLDKN